MGGFIAQLAKSVLAQPNSASSRFAACLLKSLRFDPHKSDRLLEIHLNDLPGVEQ